MPQIIQPTVQLDNFADRLHAIQHRKGGVDPLSPSDIGASAVGHTHRPADIGAAAADHTHTASAVGASALGHTHEPSEVGAAAYGHTHTAAEVGAADVEHTHVPADIGAAASGHTHEPASIGAAASDHVHTPAAIGAATADHTHSASDVGASAVGHTHLPSEVGASASNHTHTAAEVGASASNHTHANADVSAAGFMSAADKIKLNSVDDDIGTVVLIDRVYPYWCGDVWDEIADGDIVACTINHKGEALGSNVVLFRCYPSNENAMTQLPITTGKMYIGMKNGVSVYYTEDVQPIFSTDAAFQAATSDMLGMVKVGSGLIIDNGVLSVAPFYGFQINFDVSDPAACITYTGAAAAMTQAERYAWAYSKVKPTVVKNGRIAYDLQRNDLTKKADGTASDLTGADGDVCASFAPLWWTCTKNGKILDVKLYEYPVAGAVSAHLMSGVIRDYLHIGMFMATGDTCDSVYSETLIPSASRTLKTFRSQAQTKNANITESLYNPTTWLTKTLYKHLFVFAYGSLNSQGTVGSGLTGYSWNDGVCPVTAFNCAEMLTCGGHFGDTSSGLNPVMALFVANPWGGMYEFDDGIIWSDGKIAMLTDQADVWDIQNGYANKPASWLEFETGLMNHTSGQYATEALGGDYGGYFPCAAGSGSSGTYLCDYEYWNTGDRCCLSGGIWCSAAPAGLFQVGVSYALSDSYSNVGARLQILNAT